jgi:hypothetical protein
MWPVGVAVVDVDVEDALELPAACDQEPVETVAADRADEAFGDRVACGARNGVRMISTPSLLKTLSKSQLNLLSRSWTGSEPVSPARESSCPERLQRTTRGRQRTLEPPIGATSSVARLIAVNADSAARPHADDRCPRGAPETIGVLWGARTCEARFACKSDTTKFTNPTGSAEFYEESVGDATPSLDLASLPALQTQREPRDRAVGERAAQARLARDPDDPANQSLTTVGRQRRLVRELEALPVEEQTGEVECS